MKFIDLFAGAGGLSEGFIRAGFLPVAHVEMDKSSCLTIKTRIAHHYLHENKKINLYIDYIQGKICQEKLYGEIPEDIIHNTVIQEELSGNTISQIIKNLENRLKTSNCNSVDVIVGGPPCQPYSLVGRARDYSQMKNDPRNYLYKLYTQFL